MDKKKEDKERFFSIELKSTAHLRNVTLVNSSHENVLVEGTIGELVQATFAEGMILEIVGKKGTLRINLREKELRSESESATTTENFSTAEQNNRKKNQGR